VFESLPFLVTVPDALAAKSLAGASRRSGRRLSISCMLILVCVLVCVLAHLQLPHRAGFLVPINTPSESADLPTVLLSAPLPLGDSACSLAFDTALSSEPEALSEAHPQPQDLWALFLQHAQDMAHCVSLKKNNDYWRYELCLTQTVTQTHNDEKYVLGKFKGPDNIKNQLLFEDGQICDALQHKPARKTTVKVLCDADAAEIRIVHIEESQVCAYTMYIATSIVCGDDRFAKAQEKFPNYQDQRAVLIEESDNSFEEWHIYVDNSDSGELFCEAFLHGSSNGALFSKVELSLNNKHFPFSRESCSIRVKGKNGDLIPLEDFDLSLGTEKVHVTSKPSFDGALTYIGVHCNSS
jgi:hypothetical protein